MARKTTARQFAADISALAESVRREVALHSVKAMPSFGEWCREVSPLMRWDWRHLEYIRAKVQPRIDALEVCLQASLAGVALTPDPSPASGRGEASPRHLILSVPPRHGKSEQVTIRLPAYLLERWPAMKIIMAAYNSRLVAKFSRKCKRIAAARIALSTDKNAVDEWETPQEGGVRAAGVGGGVTGTGGHLIVIDDPVKSREEANSATYREKVWDWFCDDLYTRLEPGGVIILIQTRWHSDDLVGRIIRSDFAADFEVVNLPAEAEFDDPLGREVGEPLCPDRFTVEALARLRTVLGRSYNALYQGHPTASEGDIVQMSWFRRYTRIPARAEIKRIVQSWDTASKVGVKNDYSVCGTWADMANGDSYLLDVFRKRLEYPGLKAAFLEQTRKHNPDIVLIEDKGHGTALLQEARNLPGHNVVAIEPEGDKVTRMSVESSAIEGGRVWLPEPAPNGPHCPWLFDFEQECQSFPLVAHDDQVDMASQYLCWKRLTGERRVITTFNVKF